MRGGGGNSALPLQQYFLALQHCFDSFFSGVIKPVVKEFRQSDCTERQSGWLKGKRCYFIFYTLLTKDPTSAQQSGNFVVNRVGK